MPGSDPASSGKQSGNKSEILCNFLHTDAEITVHYAKIVRPLRCFRQPVPAKMYGQTKENDRTNLEERADIGPECSFRCSRCLFSDPDEQPEDVKFSDNKLKYKRISNFPFANWLLPRTSGRKSATLTGPNMQNVSRMTKG